MPTSGKSPQTLPTSIQAPANTPLPSGRASHSPLNHYPLSKTLLARKQNTCPAAACKLQCCPHRRKMAGLCVRAVKAKVREKGRVGQGAACTVGQQLRAASRAPDRRVRVGMYVRVRRGCRTRHCNRVRCTLPPPPLDWTGSLALVDGTSILVSRAGSHKVRGSGTGGAEEDF